MSKIIYKVKIYGGYFTGKFDANGKPIASQYNKEIKRYSSREEAAFVVDSLREYHAQLIIIEFSEDLK